MNYTNNSMPDMMACSELKMEKEIGIYEQTKETRMILGEILLMLDGFKREIRDYKEPSRETAIEPTCFRDEVTCVNSLAFAIKGDLHRLMDEFH